MTTNTKAQIERYWSKENQEIRFFLNESPDGFWVAYADQTGDLTDIGGPYANKAEAEEVLRKSAAEEAEIQDNLGYYGCPVSISE